MQRTETRRERSLTKIDAKVFPFEVCTINFQVEENVAFILRSAACFGASAVNVIGTIPEHKFLVQRGGTCQDYVQMRQFSNVHDFLMFAKAENIQLIAAELDDEAVSIHEFEFPVDQRVCIVLGHETMGVPPEILMNSLKVFIPMPGKGFCLNTSQTGNIFLHEAAKAYAR